jgi:hypothetical protein
MTNNEINQTALQEFWGKISLKLSFEQIDEFVPLFYQAKEMEKEQHEATALAMIEYALDNIEGKNNLNGKDAFEQYYNKTYGGNK